MSLAHPIFIQAMWRAGSTYVWKKFRDNPGYRAYFEPLHESLLQSREQVEATCGVATRTALRHPAMEEFYFAEYPFSPSGGVENFKKRFSYERYCLGETEQDEDLRGYVAKLNEHAARQGQRGVFQFNRGLLRSAWLAHHFPSIQILVLREPLAVWKSFRSFEGLYFQTRLCTILGQNRNTSPVRHLVPWMEFPREIRDTVDEETGCYRAFAEKNGEWLYPSFFDFYLLSMVQCAQHADCILDLDEITRNPDARRAATERLRELGIEMDFADCKLPSYAPEASDREWLAYEECGAELLASILPSDVSISKERFEGNSALLGGYFRSLLGKFVERRSLKRAGAAAASAGQKSEKHLQAIRLFEEREFEGSARLLGAELAERPASSELWNDWATTQNACQHRHLAELGFRVALRSDPVDREAAGNLGVLLVAEGRFREALPLLERAELDANEKTRPVISRLVNRARASLGFFPTAAGGASGADGNRLGAQAAQARRRGEAGLIGRGANASPAILPARKGLAIFITGLSGAGKSTIGSELARAISEREGRAVILLDGDVARKFLSSELGFSKEHRDMNVRRIGFVAAQVTRSGGIAVCSCIAPYDAVRREVRAMIEPDGGFFLVHIATPLEVCARRDPKGLYAKARAGLLAQFTGISDPYEEPGDAEITVDTSETSVEVATQLILAYVARSGYLADEVFCEGRDTLAGLG